VHGNELLSVPQGRKNPGKLDQLGYIDDSFDPNGKEELCYPEGETDAPAQATELIFPSHEKKAFALDQGLGMQTFALLASRAPLPAYAQWQASVGRAAVGAGRGGDHLALQRQRVCGRGA
jgi:hypothetical protein